MEAYSEAKRLAVTCLGIINYIEECTRLEEQTDKMN